MEIQRKYVSQNKLGASQGSKNVLVCKLFYRFYPFNFTHKQVLKVLCICICVCICVWSNIQTPYTVHHKLLSTILRKDQVIISWSAKFS